MNPSTVFMGLVLNLQAKYPNSKNTGSKSCPACKNGGPQQLSTYPEEKKGDISVRPLLLYFKFSIKNN
jgi:hypothetical protein